MVDIVIMYLSKFVKCTPRVNPSVNYWVIMMCQCQFTDYKKCTNAGGMLIMGEACVGTGVIQKISVPSSQFFCESKTALKKIKSL